MLRSDVGSMPGLENLFPPVIARSRATSIQTLFHKFTRGCVRCLTVDVFPGTPAPTGLWRKSLAILCVSSPSKLCAGVRHRRPSYHAWIRRRAMPCAHTKFG